MDSHPKTDIEITTMQMINSKGTASIYFDK